MRCLKVFSFLLLFGVFVSNIAQARQYNNWVIPFDETQFKSILDEQFDSGILSVKYILNQDPELGKNKNQLIDNLWINLTNTRNGILSGKFKGGGVYLNNSTEDYEISFLFDGASTEKIHVRVNAPD